MPASHSKEREPDGDDGASSIVQRVTEVSADARDGVTEIATHAERAVERVDSSLRARSDRSLGLVGAFSLGTAIGLLVAGSSRLLIAAALAPAALIAGALMERMDREDITPPRTLH